MLSSKYIWHLLPEWKACADLLSPALSFQWLELCPKYCQNKLQTQLVWSGASSGEVGDSDEPLLPSHAAPVGIFLSHGNVLKLLVI